MPNRTIAKFSLFVILCAAGGLTAACGHLSQGRGDGGEFDRGASPFGPPSRVGRIASPEVVESSGLAVSKCQQNVFWTHNDSGDGAFVYAFAGDGKHLGTWKVTGAVNMDWEDMASTEEGGGCYLYIADIGDNGKKRGEGTIYRVTEPAVMPNAAASSRRSPMATDAAEVLNFTYESKYDAETLAVNPNTGDIYVLTKRREGPAAVYKIKPQFGPQPVAAEKVGEVRVPSIPDGLLTGGDISPDGTRVALCDYVAGYELTLPPGAQYFDEIWKQAPAYVDLGEREVGESIAYSPDGNSLFATSEGGGSPIFEVKRR
jgi:hypothetical protein